MDTDTCLHIIELVQFSQAAGMTLLDENGVSIFLRGADGSVWIWERLVGETWCLQNAKS